MNSNKKIVTAIVAFIVIAGFVYAVNSKPTSNSVVIGASLPLTGASASFGERAKDGIEIALNDINSSRSKKIEIAYEDDKGDAPTAVTVMNKLIDQEHVVAVIGPLKSDPMLAVAPIAEAKKEIVLSPTAGASAITTAGDYVFRNIEKPDVHGQTAAKYLKDSGIDQVALFTAQASNAQGYGKLFKQYYEQSGGKIVVAVEYNPASTDFRTDIKKAEQSGAQAFYLAVSTGKDAGILVKQIRELGFKGTIMASIAAESKEFVDTAGGSSEGVLLTSPAYDVSSHADYAEKFKTKFGKESDWVSANSYDAVTLLVGAIDSCEKDGRSKDTNVQSACIKSYLYAVKDYNGVGSLTTFDAHGDVIKPVLIKKVVSGKFEVVK